MSEKNPFYGATFAERKAIRETAEKTAPTPDDEEAAPQSAPLGTAQSEKAVEADETENKAVRSAPAKKRAARKKS